MPVDTNDRLRYSVSLVTQGKHRFYTLTMPSDVLAKTCFVSTRDEDPEFGFQRVLDEGRAQQIGEYMDSGLGTIPSSIVLSAQPDAMLKVLGRGKTIEFSVTRKAFLVLDGQHRVWGFGKARTVLRVPVVIYNGLTRQDESRLFIDINTKQRPVPTELLLDIKSLADYETDEEKVLNDVFDLFSTRTDSPLLGLMSPATKAGGKISRVTFNASLKPHLAIFGSVDPQAIYETLRAYLKALLEGLRLEGVQPNITNPTVFRASMMLFRDAARRVKDRFSADYATDNFREVLSPMFSRSKATWFKTPGSSSRTLYENFLGALESGFTL